MANLFNPEWDADQDLPPFRWRRSRLGKQAGSELLGASLFELEPGCSSFPLHVHHANEELLLVISGRPTLRTLDAERELEPGEVIAFRRGRAGAHRIENRSDAACRFAIVSTMIAPEVNEYPESGKVWARTWPPGGEAPAEGTELIGRPETNLDYLDGER